MYYISVEDSFSSAHQLREYKGKCENLHGHNWLIKAVLCGKTLDSSGMLLDFTILKKYLKDILELLDHRNLNDIPPFDKLNPSAENLAFYIFSTLKNKLSDNHSQAKVYRIDVYESFKSFASYTEDAIGVNNV